MLQRSLGLIAMISDMIQNNISAFAIFCILFVLTWLFMKTKRPPGIPPGPTPIPYLGNFLQLRGDARKVFRRLRAGYGDIFSVFMGHRLVIVVNGYEALKETFVKNADVFSDRSPRIRIPAPEFWYNIEGIIRANGEVWKTNRRFALSTLRDFGMGKNKLQTSIQEEAKQLMHAIETLNGKAFDPTHLLQNAVSNIISSTVFGKRFEYHDQHFQHYLNTISNTVKIAGVQGKLFKYAFLRKLPGDITNSKRMTKNISEISDFTKTLIMERLEVYDENNINCIIDAYIKQEKLDTKNISSEDIYGLELLKIISDLFVAGTETTSTVLRWLFLYFVNYPEIQTKVFSHVSDVVDRRRLPGVEDRIHLPYLEATISETLRHANILPMSVDHGAKDDAQLMGYHIPKGSVVIANLDSVMTDPQLWKNPDRFDPDRFIENEALKKFDYFFPFSLGKRVCLGESLARMELTIFSAALTRHFEFLPPEGESPPPIEGSLGITFSPNPYKVRAVKRTTN